MTIQNRDSSRTGEPGYGTNKHTAYYAAVPAHVLACENSVFDELISFAFDTLGSWRLDVRVYDDSAARAQCEPGR